MLLLLNDCLVYTLVQAYLNPCLTFASSVNKSISNQQKVWNHTCDHDHLDSSWPALGHSLLDTRPGRIGQWYEAEKSELGHRKIYFFLVELKSYRIDFRRKFEITKSENPLTPLTHELTSWRKFHPPLIRERYFSSLHHDGLASLEQSF